MDQFTRDDLRELLNHNQIPCASVYARTTRGGRNEDNTRWKNLIRQAEDHLVARGLQSFEARDFVGPLVELGDSVPFWQDVSAGVAAFLAPGLFRAYRLPLPLTDQVLVADHFHLKPVLPLFAGGRFYVLVLAERDFRLLRCTPDTVQEYALPGANKLHDPNNPFRDLGVAQATSRDSLTEYYHRVDERLRKFLGGDQAPLLLAGLGKQREVYRGVNTHPHLLAEELECFPDQLAAADLQARAGPIIDRHFREVQDRNINLYHQGVGIGRASNDLAEVVKAAYQGQVQILFVALGREHWGRFDRVHLEVIARGQRLEADEDLLDVAAGHTLAHGGVVFAVEPARVPGGGPLAGIFRQPLGERSGKKTITGSMAQT